VCKIQSSREIYQFSCQNAIAGPVVCCQNKYFLCEIYLVFLKIPPSKTTSSLSFVKSTADYILVEPPKGIDFLEVLFGLSKLLSMPKFHDKNDIWVFREGKMGIP